jgi:hypothetical protein
VSQSQLSSLIWSVADLLRGTYRQSEYDGFGAWIAERAWLAL